jgi:hypothetical protein
MARGIRRRGMTLRNHEAPVHEMRDLRLLNVAPLPGTVLIRFAPQGSVPQRFHWKDSCRNSRWSTKGFVCH